MQSRGQADMSHVGPRCNQQMHFEALEPLLAHTDARTHLAELWSGEAADPQKARSKLEFDNVLMSNLYTNGAKQNLLDLVQMPCCQCHFSDRLCWPAIAQHAGCSVNPQQALSLCVQVSHSRFDKIANLLSTKP